MTSAPSTSVPAPDAAWQRVADAYGQLRTAQLDQGDLSASARSARQAIDRAWTLYQTGAEAGAPLIQPVVTYRPFAGLTEVALTTFDYAVTVAFDTHSGDVEAVSISPEPGAQASVPRILHVAAGLLWDLYAAANRRGDGRSAALWTCAYAALDAYRAGWLEGQADDGAEVPTAALTLIRA